MKITGLQVFWVLGVPGTPWVLILNYFIILNIVNTNVRNALYLRLGHGHLSLAKQPKKMD